ncbi:MAG: hypothetical protein RMH84_01995 [Sulfolobales archaeon]|nr:hypothetical protein [Sulfolobales archaeon]
MRGDAVMGLKENRPCYVLKMKHLISYLRTLPKPAEAIYIVDEESCRNEIDIAGLFNKIFVIKNGSIVAYVTARNGRALERML